MNGTDPVCRYFIPAEQGYSHFFSASPAECAKVRREVSLVRQGVGCGHAHRVTQFKHRRVQRAATVPVYRVWNGGDSNHRYVTEHHARSRWLATDGSRKAMARTPYPCARRRPSKRTPPRRAAAAVQGQRFARRGAGRARTACTCGRPTPTCCRSCEKDVIGKDPTLCGASLVIFWSAVETAKGVYDWTAVTTAAQAVHRRRPHRQSAVLGSHRSGHDQPGHAGVGDRAGQRGRRRRGIGHLRRQPTMPVYWDPAYEAAWTSFIAAAIQQFSFGNSPIATNVGYMRFATGRRRRSAGAGRRTATAAIARRCGPAAGYTYDVVERARGAHHQRHGYANRPTSRSWRRWRRRPAPRTSTTRRTRALQSRSRDKSAFRSRTWASATWPPRHRRPAPCDPQAQIANLHWCQAYTNYVGQVPFAAQPITATTNTNVVTMDIAKLLQYGLANHIQIFELYPEEWLSANSPTWPSFDARPSRQSTKPHCRPRRRRSARQTGSSAPGSDRAGCRPGSRGPPHCHHVAMMRP